MSSLPLINATRLTDFENDFSITTGTSSSSNETVELSKTRKGLIQKFTSAINDEKKYPAIKTYQIVKEFTGVVKIFTIPTAVESLKLFTGILENLTTLSSLPTAIESPFEALWDQEFSSLAKELSALRNEENDKLSQIASRIEYLIHAGKGESQSSTVSIRSTKEFINFTRNNLQLLKPSIVFSPNRNIRAQWGKERNNKAILEFSPSGFVDYVVFTKSPSAPSSKRIYSTGSIPHEMLLNALAPFGGLPIEHE